MENYDLLREDWDSILELAQFTGRPETAQQISSKVSRYKYTTRDTAMYQTYILAKFGLISSDHEIGVLLVAGLEVAVRWLAVQVVVIDPLGASELLPSSAVYCNFTTICGSPV